MAKWVIVVDDDTANLQVAGRILSQNNIRVTALKSGQSLLDYVEENGFPDMLLLDIKMPVMDGFETLRRFREKETDKDVEETPVVFLTADEDSETEKRGFEVGVSDFIRKPFNPDVLLKRINNIISTNSEMRTLKTEASTDGLTGLLNKGSVKEEMSKACSELNGCLLMADLDAFKLVNDLHGHDAGDKILKVFSQVLVEYVSSDGILGRIGGDEFVIFYPGLNDEKDAVEFGAKVNARMAEEADRILGENDIPLGVTMGGVFVPAYGNDYQALLKLADKALYSVKKTGKHRCAVYKEESGFDESDNGLYDIYSISEILGERNIPNVALQLDKEAFSYVYRYIMRDIIRNRRSACKVLFTLEKNKGAKDDAFVNLCDEFGTHIRESLRKSDILMRNMSNQYFVFLTDIKTQAVDKVVGNIADEWYKKFGRDAHISIETDIIFNDAGQQRVNNDFNVVVVDDDLINLKVAGQILCDGGIRTTVIKSGRALLSYAENNIPDLILLDIKMPDMDGYETLKRLREMNGNASMAPVIFLTGDESMAAES